VISGRVVGRDGKNTGDGAIEKQWGPSDFEYAAAGRIEPDGTFRWGTERAGDGAPAGQYRVIVMPVALGDSELAEGKQPAVDGKYTKYGTSGITFEVKPGKNELNITVTRPKPKKAS